MKIEYDTFTRKRWMRTITAGSKIVVRLGYRHDFALVETSIARIGKRQLWIDVSQLPAELSRVTFDKKTGLGWGHGLCLFPVDDSWAAPPPA